MARLSIFLIAVALVAGMVVCGGGDGEGGGEPEYIHMVAAGWVHTICMKSDGTVGAVGYNSDG